VLHNKTILVVILVTILVELDNKTMLVVNYFNELERNDQLEHKKFRYFKDGLITCNIKFVKKMEQRKNWARKHAQTVFSDCLSVFQNWIWEEGEVWRSWRMVWPPLHVRNSTNYVGNIRVWGTSGMRALPWNNIRLVQTRKQALVI